MSNHENHDGPFIVTGRREYSPFYGRTLFSSWDIDVARDAAIRIAVSDPSYRSVSLSRGGETIMTVNRRRHRFGHTFDMLWR